MKFFSRLLATAVFLCVMFAPTFAGTAQSGIQQYAYISYDAPETATVWLIDPSSLETTVLTTISANTGETIGAAFLSPTNDWIVVRFTLGQTASLRLINLSSGEIANVIDGFAFPLRPNSIGGDFDVFEWSPNGQYFAFFTQVGDEGQTLYVYNVQTQTLTNIGSPGENQYQLSWSPDGDRLAFVSLACVVSGCTNAVLNVYDMTRMAAVHAIDLAQFAGNSGTESVNFCEIKWSTDASFISFFDFCDSSAFGTPREMQIVDLNSEVITQVTSLTPTDVPPTNSLYNATHDAVWIDSSALLMGTRFLTGEAYPAAGTVTSYTTLYDRQNQSVSVIDSRRLGRWARANDQLIAHAVYSYALDSDNSPVLTSSNIEVSSFDGQILTRLASGPSGCLLSWIRSADILAYIGSDDIAPGGLCEPGFETLHFLTTTHLQSFVVDQGQRAAALGWYTRSGDLASPTPAPTQASGSSG
ncbi:MAG: PD40 domain-containing protein [Pleurocapsa minor GSE-CHR-MK-17-07R]|jgi:hypothetical protein|nr:PD40 domain-containing protein [Pleurocapsa minor GSE-CHR-MK 17-07R]